MATTKATVAPLFDWQDCHCLGIELIDRQHKRIFSLINDLHTLLVDGENPSATCQVFSELVITVAHHFRTEEVLMEFTRYPELLAHQAEHRQLMNAIGLLNKNSGAGKFALGIQDIDLVRSWVLEHTVKSDQKYKPFLKQFL
jgi:hemerythrin-like metal-binding protein